MAAPSQPCSWLSKELSQRLHRLFDQVWCIRLDASCRGVAVAQAQALCAVRQGHVVRASCASEAFCSCGKDSPVRGKEGQGGAHVAAQHAGSSLPAILWYASAGCLSAVGVGWVMTQGRHAWVAFHLVVNTACVVAMRGAWGWHRMVAALCHIGSGGSVCLVIACGYPMWEVWGVMQSHARGRSRSKPASRPGWCTCFSCGQAQSHGMDSDSSCTCKADDTGSCS
mmetsp:Transcript_14225/g.35144  ORF Transcript_14225/g.35144 Transcript_14225/m.35144 type:complete len:225 (-) Transcript_14225:307-981(-)